MTADDDSSDLSSLPSLSPVPSDVELDDNSDDATTKSKSGILKFFPKLSEQPPKEPSPPPRKRSPSPPHEYVLADNPDIAELERDVVEPIPGDRVEHLLCAILGLLLNRKQDVKLGHYGRALEDAITSHKNQWPASWEDKNPLSGGATFNSMTPTERLTLLRTLILWAMASSDTVKGLINSAYKQNRQEDDMNQPRSVQPWGSDGDKRRYFLVEGQDDTNFRIYRESNPAGTNRSWFSVAGSIEELKALAEKLETKDGGPKAKRLSQKMLQVIPRFEAGEEKRKRREYRQMRKEQFKRPEPGFSMYEGRTRGKRIKYTYSDDEDGFFSDSTGARRSARNTGANTPAETGPVTTSSGRQIRAPPRLNMVAGDSAPGSIQGENSELEHDHSIGTSGRTRRPAANQDTNNWSERNSQGDGTDEESEAEFGDDEEDAHVPEESEDEDDFDEAEAMVEDDLDDQRQTLVVKLSVTTPKLRTVLSPIDEGPNMLPTPDTQDWKVDTTVPETRTVEMQDVPAPEAHTIPSERVRKEPTQTSSGDVTEKIDAIRAPTLSGIPSTSLAFRGSPEKPHAQLASPSGDFNDTT
ncbi:hypothetical protein MAC_03127 [Metarhizium acridum CQMa 102]|uniref:WHIM1 domain-containing protein n=1 Tax=Metarhizium acridum (strain CQMa 102) TaxID=655827 RepID=E9DZS9_METAQ|nr:uncharacterized protein MAC_03127 [Metarhizium acridum CQMa 102]EFY90764.1 hypothetical protein MAC_03127 [Metarhizium acridum CQMa 102]